MDLNLAAVIFMGGYVLAIVGAALVMAVRPGGSAIRFPAGIRPTPGVTGRRQEILLGGEAETFGIPRGRVLAVLLRPETAQIQELALATALGLVEDGHVPAEAILSADGDVVQLGERWTEPALDGPVAPAIALRRGMTIRSAERKRLGKLRLVCFDQDSGAVTALVVAGRRSAGSLRLLPTEHVHESGPNGLITDLKASEWHTLQPFANDRTLEQAVRERLWADPVLRSFQRSLTIEVQDQQVRLRGYVTNRATAGRAVELAQSVPGVLLVDQAIVADEELAQAVGQALGQDPATAAARIEVRSRFGQVAIAGKVADPAAMRQIEEVASGVPGVQSVHNLTTVR